MGPENAAINLTVFLWVVFAVDVSYVFMVPFQKLKLGSYPAPRHQVDRTSVVVITLHILCGATVVWGGSALWFVLQANWIASIPAWTGTTLAAATYAHSATNIALMRKIPGVRLLNVPLYVVITAYNVCRANWLLAEPTSQRQYLLLWCAVSTFIWVRLFILTFLIVTRCKAQDVKLYGTIYSVALPYAGMFGIIVPLAGLGADARWLMAFAAVAVVAPLMVEVHTVCGVVSAWPVVGRSEVCRWVLRWVTDSTNPVEYHGQSCTAGASQVLAVATTSPNHDASGYTQTPLLSHLWQPKLGHVGTTQLHTYPS